MPYKKENISPIRLFQSVNNDSQQYYPVSYKAFTLTPSFGVNIALNIASHM